MRRTPIPTLTRKEGAQGGHPQQYILSGNVRAPENGDTDRSAETFFCGENDPSGADSILHPLVWKSKRRVPGDTTTWRPSDFNDGSPMAPGAATPAEERSLWTPLLGILS